MWWAASYFQALKLTFHWEPTPHAGPGLGGLDGMRHLRAAQSFGTQLPPVTRFQSPPPQVVRAQFRARQIQLHCEMSPRMCSCKTLGSGHPSPLCLAFALVPAGDVGGV